MHIAAQSISELAHRWPTDDELSWFAVRQPGALKLLEKRMRSDDDAFAVALASAWRLFAAYNDADGIPCPRLTHEILQRAGYAVAREVAGVISYDGLARRQPDLCQFVATALANPPFPLTLQQQGALAEVLFTLIYAMDEVTFGRPVS
jgi:hypothetical protein